MSQGEVEKVLVLGNQHVTVICRELQNFNIRCIRQSDVLYMRTFVPSLRDPTGKPLRHLTVNKKFQDTCNTMWSV